MCSFLDILNFNICKFSEIKPQQIFLLFLDFYHHLKDKKKIKTILPPTYPNFFSILIETLLFVENKNNFFLSLKMAWHTYKK